MDASQYAALFYAESREHLSACNKLLLEWERNPAASEPVVGVFRSMHTIKGMAATMGYARVTELAHRSENVLDALRAQRLKTTPDLLDLLFRTVDALERGIDEAVAGRDAGLEVSALLSELDQAAGASPDRPSAAVAQPADSADGAVAEGGRRVTVVIDPGAVMRGARATLALRRAEALGRVSGVRPAPGTFEQDNFTGRFVFGFESEAGDAAVEEAIRAAGDVQTVTIELAGSAEATAEVGMVRGRVVRVDLRRLDSLMNQIGELVVAKGRLAELTAADSSPELEAVGARIGRLVSEMQGEVIQARMTPVQQVFERFPRLVRDVARQLGKKVAFEMQGGEIELDRSILDEIGDPLVHLIRNALDHGIETPVDRKKGKKGPEGRLTLSAQQDRTGVAIRVSDDGRGVDRARILKKAVGEGFLDAATESLDDDTLLRVLARPGFTTAGKVTDVSGRGVGIDVVLTKVRTLGGSVEIRTAEGQGTTFILRLPVTLAIVRVLLARLGDERYAIPLSHVAETVEFDRRLVTAVQGREALVLRDQVIPTVHLRDVLGVAGDPGEGKRPTIILEVGDRRAALVVDALVGQQEIVVEPFKAPRGTLPVFTGAAILGDGRPALILDAAALV